MIRVERVGYVDFTKRYAGQRISEVHKRPITKECNFQELLDCEIEKLKGSKYETTKETN